MDVVDPTAPTEAEELNSRSARMERLEGKMIGLYNNAKLTAGPILNVVQQKSDEEYSNVTFVNYSMEHLNWGKDPDKLDAVGEWARDESDVCLSTVTDCGSCTKYLVWGIQAIEQADIHAAGLIDKAFELDWQLNAIKRHCPLRYDKIPVHADVQDEERISEKLTAAIESLEGGFIRPLNEREQGNASP